MLHLGHYPGLDDATLKQAAEGGTIQKWLYEVRPRLGDMFLVKAGYGPNKLHNYYDRINTHKSSKPTFTRASVLTGQVRTSLTRN